MTDAEALTLICEKFMMLAIKFVRKIDLKKELNFDKQLLHLLLLLLLLRSLSALPYLDHWMLCAQSQLQTMNLTPSQTEKWHEVHLTRHGATSVMDTAMKLPIC